jgi:hypothetical protein
MSREDRERVPDKQLLGIPSLQDFGAGAADGHLDFSIVVPMTGEAVLDALLTFGRAFAESGVDVGMGALTCFHPRALTFISSFPVSRDDREANRRTRDTYLRCVALAAQRGWGQVSRARGVHGRSRRNLRVRPRRSDALPRSPKGRRGPERDSGSGPLRHVATTLAQDR